MAGGKKELTPKQISNGISYVQKEAPFLARLKNKTQEKEIAQRKFENYEDGQDDDDYDELEGAQVVELDDKGKEIHKDVGEKSQDEEEEEEEEKEKEKEQPAIDENGRILFRKQKSKSTDSKRKLKSIIDEEINKTQKKSEEEPEKKKKKKKSNKPTASLLSFGDAQDE